MDIALGYAREKLALYRAQHPGAYVGGVEYTALMKLIDAARLPVNEGAQRNG